MKMTVYLLVFLQLKTVSCIDFSTLGLDEDLQIVEAFRSLAEDISNLDFDIMKEQVQVNLDELMHLLGGHLAQLRMLLFTLLFTVSMMAVIARCHGRKRGVLLLKHIAEVDRKIFVANAEISLLQQDIVESVEISKKEKAVTKDLEEQLDKLEVEMSLTKKEIDDKKDQIRILEVNLSEARSELVDLRADHAENLGRVELMNKEISVVMIKIDEKKMQIKRLKTEVEDQKQEIDLSRENIRVKENEINDLRNDLSEVKELLDNSKLQSDLMKEELSETNVSIQRLTQLNWELEKESEVLRKEADNLQSRLDAESEVYGKVNEEMSCLRSKIVVFENECQLKDNEILALNEVLESKLLASKGGVVDTVETDGWELDDDLLEIDTNELKEEARLRIEKRTAEATNEALEKQIRILKSEVEGNHHLVKEMASQIEILQVMIEKTTDELKESEKKFAILTEYSAKKEEELFKRLEAETSKVEALTSESESDSRRLEVMMNELEVNKASLKMLKQEFEDQELSLKSAYVEAEKKAHENWVSARQSDRKVQALQKELSQLRRMLTEAEGNKEVNDGLNKSTVTAQDQRSLPPLPGLSNIPTLLPSLPAFPGVAYCPTVQFPSIPVMPPLLSHPSIPNVFDPTNSLMNSTDLFGNMRNRSQSVSSVSPCLNLDGYETNMRRGSFSHIDIVSSSSEDIRFEENYSYRKDADLLI